MGAVGYTGGDPNKVDVAGDTMTGPLVLPGDPSLDLEAATKQYVDNNSGGGGGGGIPATTVTSETSFGIAPVVGTGTKYARDDHTHGSPAAPTAASVGAATSGHNHNSAYDPLGSASAALSAALAADPTPGGAVVTETDYGQSSSVGAATTYSRSDHTHGTPGAVDITGKVSGPASATDNAVARFDATTGKIIQNSLFVVNDLGAAVLTPLTSPAWAAGQLFYDAVNQCITFHNDNSGVAMQVGQELWLRVRNVTGSTIANGAPVYISGASAGLPTIALANANAIGTVPAAGLTTEAIANNTNGYVTIAGVVNDLNTNSFAAGAQLYVGTTAGALTATAPAAPNFRNRVGSVMSVSLTTGQILVTPGAAVIGFGTANQIIGMNSGATAQEYKTVNGTTNQITVTHAANAITLALANNTALPGAPTAATAAAATSTTQIATTAFVTTADNLKANLAGPTFTGVPAAPTAAQGVNTTQIATTAYVQTEVGLLVPRSLVDIKGDILAATADNTLARLAVGANDTVLTADSSTATGLKWATPAGGGGTDFKVAAYPRTGLWYRSPSFGPVGSNVTTALNTLFLTVFRLGAATTFDRITCDVTGANGAGAVMRMGIWAADATGSFPGTLILDVGLLGGGLPAGDTTGQKIVTISQLLPIGVYWLGVVAQVAGGGSVRGSTSIDPLIPYFTGAGANFGATAPGGIQTGATVSGALASTPTITDNNNGPIIGLRSA